MESWRIVCCPTCINCLIFLSFCAICLLEKYLKAVLSTDWMVLGGVLFQTELSASVVDILGWISLFWKKVQLDWPQKAIEKTQGQGSRETESINNVVLIYAWMDTILNKVDGATKMRDRTVLLRKLTWERNDSNEWMKKERLQRRALV